MKDNTLAKLLYANFNISLTTRHVSMLHRWMQQYESRPGNAEAFGSALLGVSKAYFLPTDEQQLFSIFDVDYAQFKRVAHSADAVNPSRIVTSNPFNILIIWLVHLFEVSGLSMKARRESQMVLIKMMQYRFFTSVVNYNFPHGANEGVMQYTIDNLSNKYDIKKAGSWKALIEKRSEDILDPKEGIHHETFVLFSPDEKGVLYAISDIQTRIRKSIINIIHGEQSGYYYHKEQGHTVIGASIVEDINGDQMLRVIESSMDSMITSVSHSATNLTEWLDYEYIRIAVGLSNDLTEDLFTRLLTKFSTMAENQAKKGAGELVKGTRKAPLFLGYEVLIATILQKTYRLCKLDKEVDLGSKVSIITKTRNIYRSSRINDDDILAIKSSVAHFINKHSDSKRDMTNSSMRIAFIVYLILLSFRHIK